MTTLEQLQAIVETLGLIDLGNAADYLDTEKDFSRLSPCEYILSEERVCHIEMSAAKGAQKKGKRSHESIMAT